VESARTGCRQAYAEPARKLGISAGGKGRSLFMPDLNEFNAVLVRAKAFKKPVHAVARIAENRIDAPPDQSLHQHVGDRLRLSHTPSPHERALFLHDTVADKPQSARRMSCVKDCAFLTQQ
jgi:hypothetical protein